jgi:DNA-directed RNA polymerase subunit E'/Rpb7
MSLTVKPKAVYKKIVHTQQGLFNQILITKSIPISINNIGNSIKETLEKAIAFQVEGKCIVEGYIKPNTVEIITFSSGLVQGSIIKFDVVFQCFVCSPVEGMQISCVAKHINKAGIRAEINETPSPVVIFIARDHNYSSALFSQIKENDEIKVRVIGQRFELNDKYISIIAELVESRPTNNNNNNKPQPMTEASMSATTAKGAVANKAKSGKLTVAKKISIAKEISTELAKEIAEEVVEASELAPALAQPVLAANEVVANEVVANEVAQPALAQPAVVNEAAVVAPVIKKRTTLKLKKSTQ